MMRLILFIFLSTILKSCIAHPESHGYHNSSSNRRQTPAIEETSLPKAGYYPDYIQAPYDYLKSFESLLTRSSIDDTSDTIHRNSGLRDIESHQMRMASQHVPHVAVYRISSPYIDPLGPYDGHETDDLPLKKHDFGRGGQNNFGGWDSFPGGFNMGGYGGGGLKKGKEAKALFILMAPLILLAVFGPFLATQAMLPWMINGGITSVSTVAGGKRKKRSTIADQRQIELERRLQLFLEVQEFIARSGNPDIVKEMGEAFMHCQRYTERRNKCLERLACEYTDNASELNREERRIGKMVLRNVIANPFVPAALTGRLKKGLSFAKSQPGRCSSYWCEAVDGPK